MACFSCGETFTGDVRLQLAKYKAEFEEKGIRRVFYKHSKNGDVHISHSESFWKVIQPKLITKKAIKDGAEYSLIQEFR